jgi:hypothetical protein
MLLFGYAELYDVTQPKKYLLLRSLGDQAMRQTFTQCLLIKTRMPLLNLPDMVRSVALFLTLLPVL